MPITLALGRMRQEDCHEFKACLGYRVFRKQCKHSLGTSHCTKLESSELTLLAQGSHSRHGIRSPNTTDKGETQNAGEGGALPEEVTRG